MLEQRAREWHYTPNKTRQWLIWLAQRMKQYGLTEFYLERLQPTWLPTKRSQILYGVFCGLSFLGLATGLAGTLLGDLLRGLNGGLIGALFFMLVGMLVGGLLNKGWRVDQVIRPTEMLKWSWKNAKPWLFIGPIFGLAIGLTGGLVFKLSGGLIGGRPVVGCHSLSHRRGGGFSSGATHKKQRGPYHTQHRAQCRSRRPPRA